MRALLIILMLASSAMAQRVANTTLAMPSSLPAAGTNGYATVTAFTNGVGAVTFINPAKLEPET